MSYRLGVDVGDTFTDVLLVEEGSGATWRAKTASTPSDQAVGVLHGVLLGLSGTAAFQAALSGTLDRLALAAALAIGLVAMASMHAVALRLLRPAPLLDPRRLPA